MWDVMGKADAAIEAVRDESYRMRGMFRHDDGSFADY